MKRPLAGGDDDADAKMKKKLRPDQEEEEGPPEEGGGGGAAPPAGFAHLDEDLLFEVLKHADARTLAMAACVSKLWHRTAQDERLWELICTRHWPNIGCGNQQLRSVVLALGGFKRLHSLYLPLSKQQQPGSASAWAPPLPPMMGVKPQTRWGKDEVNLFLSLLSIRCYEKMNPTSRGR
ncbi:F-box protein GID2 [Eucalyptus grandis]|nr:F-box protein GID2 [Eucalyptus grandis]